MTEELSLTDLEGLARVAEGQASRVPERVVERLLQQGLVQRPARHLEGGAALELTPAGLVHVRSSDQ